jgi:hypothetical protein
MARVVRLDTDEEIGYFVGLYGPLPSGGHSLEAWHCEDGTLRHTPPADNDRRAPIARAAPIKISMPVLDPQRADCILVVSPTYLDFITAHPAFRPLPPRRRRSR